MPEFQFSSITEFLAMGGYGAYVWPAYAAFLLFLSVNLIPPLLSRRRLERDARKAILRDESKGSGQLDRALPVGKPERSYPF